jgi:hypothetical protein
MHYRCEIMQAHSYAPVIPQHVIEPLCKPFFKQADWILELYAMSKEPASQPGKCLHCFYRLMEAASEEKAFALYPLKHWIEQNLIIGVRTGEQVRGTLPVVLDQPDMESFCKNAMLEVRNRARSDADIMIFLELYYKCQIHDAA